MRGRKAIDLQIKLPKLANKNVKLTVRLQFQTIIISVSTYVAWQALILKLFAEFWKFIFNQHFVFFSWQPMFKRLDSGWLHRSHERHWKTKAYYHSQRKKNHFGTEFNTQTAKDIYLPWIHSSEVSWSYIPAQWRCTV